jgi:hypothetical protein
MRASLKLLGGCVAAAFVVGDIGTAHSQDFFTQLFGGFSRRVERPLVRMPFANEIQDDGDSRPQRVDDESPRAGGGQAYCVRTCDGRYFPITAQGEQSKAASCNNFCPTSETRVFYGSTIDTASSDNGRRYSELPNAFKYRTELVAGCTCNGKTTTGLAPVKIEDDPTLRRGDIVAGADGLMVNRGSDRRGASLNFSPASDAVRAKYDRAPAVASD